jgi:GTP-binding protein EngB required for normal cell division
VLLMSDQELDFDAFMNSHHFPSVQGSEGDVTVPEDVNRYLHHPQQGLELCAQLITDGNKQPQVYQLLHQMELLVEQQFLTHSEHDTNRAGTRTYKQLRGLMQQLEEVIAFPSLEKYYTVAVGGSFSAGKSRFLNSVLGCPSLLPEDTTPTTSIPTYLSYGQEDRIQALNVYGGKTDIDEDAMNAICHAFSRRFGVTFSHLLQLISVERQDFRYHNLSFLDTPGYSKADDLSQRGTNTDEVIAHKHLRDADYVIWLVDQQSGTIPKPDIEFIQNLGVEQPILFVISKADKKPEQQIQEIIETARKDLELAEINYLDVIGYSSQLNREFSNSGSVLANMLETINQGKGGSTLVWQLQQIFNRYINHYQSDQEIQRLSLKTLNELRFDESITQANRKHLNDMHRKTKSQLDSLISQQKNAEVLKQQSEETVQSICEQLQLTTCTDPSRVQLVGLRQKTDEHSEVDYQFEAAIKGSLTLFAHQQALDELPGRVDKISPLGVRVKIEQPLEIWILSAAIRKQVTTEQEERLFYLGCPVQVQVVNKQRCVVKVTATD